MKVPISAFAFVCAFYGGIQLPGRIFYKFTPSKNEGITHSVYSSSQDMVSKFRMFETFENHDPRGDIANYLTMYETKPLTRSEMIDNLAIHALSEFDLSKIYRVKRAGKDLDPLYWSFGKIHGLENIAFADPEELRATNGNPVKIQKIVDRYDGAPDRFDSYEQVVEEMQKTLKDYKAAVDKLGFNSSDRKKVLALPFYLAKRQELAEPRRGQLEFKLFKELTGHDWYDDYGVEVDKEHKITEFNYE